MSIALTGFLTGFAKAGKERIEKEREENEALIANRLKMAQTNRLLRQKELDAQKQLLTGRLESVSSYLPPDATEEQKLALISNEEIATRFLEESRNNRVPDLNTFLVMNKDKIPQNFSSVRQYIDTISAAPAPVSQEQIDAIRQTRGFLGARTGANVEKMAQQYGVSAGELLAYEQRGEMPQLPDVARMNIEAIRQPKSLAKQIDEAETMASDAMDKFGTDSPEAQNAIARHAELKTRQDMLNPTQERFVRMVDEARANVVIALRDGDPKKIAAAQRELDRVESVTKREVDEKMNINDIRRSFRDVSLNAVSLLYPRLKENLVAVRDPVTNQIIDYQSASRDPVVAAQIQNTRLAAMSRIYYNFYSTQDGLPSNRKVAEALVSAGVEFDRSGRPIFQVEVPQAPPPAPNAQRSSTARRTNSRPQTGTAQPAPTPQQSIPRPTTQAEYDALRPGTIYIDTDGQEKRKR